MPRRPDGLGRSKPGADEAGLRLDAALAARGLAPSRAAAQRMIDAGLVKVGARRARSRTSWRRERRSPSPTRPRRSRSRPRPPSRSPTRTTTCWWSTSRPGSSCTPAPVRGGRPSSTRSRAVRRAVPTPSAPGSCTGSTATRRGCWSWPAPTRSTPSSRGCSAGARSCASTSRSSPGGPTPAAARSTPPIGRDRANRTVMSTRTDKPRRAVTHFTVAEELPRTTLLDVRLETGRTHQIRAHLAELGLPVCGDVPYGGGRCGDRIGLERPFLHSKKLMFRHPVTGGEVLCESKPPAELHRALDAARRDIVSGGPDGDFS